VNGAKATTYEVHYSFQVANDALAAPKSAPPFKDTMAQLNPSTNFDGQTFVEFSKTVRERVNGNAVRTTVTQAGLSSMTTKPALMIMRDQQLHTPGATDIKEPVATVAYDCIAAVK
jgi:hypothetical protein